MGAPNCMNIYFRKSDSSTDDGQKIIRGITEPELTTVDGQKIMSGITKADLTTVNGQKNYRGCQKPGRGAKMWRAKKVAMKNEGLLELK